MNSKRRILIIHKVRLIFDMKIFKDIRSFTFILLSLAIVTAVTSFLLEGSWRVKSLLLTFCSLLIIFMIVWAWERLKEHQSNLLQFIINTLCATGLTYLFSRFTYQSIISISEQVGSSNIIFDYLSSLLILGITVGMITFLFSSLKNLYKEIRRIRQK